MNQIQLEAYIRSAFENVSYPGHEKLGDPMGRDDAENIAKNFRGLDWRYLSTKNKLPGLALHFMTPEAAHYYLPAYLIVAMNDIGGDALSGVFTCLDPHIFDQSKKKDRFLVFSSLFSVQQRQCLHEFLMHIRSSLNKFREENPDDWLSYFDNMEGTVNVLLEYWN
jgi:hypothetical protein